MEQLKGRKALIIGASSGIGAEVARRYAAAGADVCLTYNANAGGAQAVADDIASKGGVAYVLHVDAATRDGAVEGVTAGTEALGGLDILVNNAGTMFGRTQIADASEDLLSKVIDLNIGSVFFACQVAAKHMAAAGRGTIINTTSIAARTGGGAGVGVYGSAKSFVSTLTRVLARELAPSGVRVNGVAPGTIATAFHDRYSTQSQLDAVTSTIPMGRLGSAEDCSGAYLFLADEALSGYITGQIIEVNGGQLMP